MKNILSDKLNIYLNTLYNKQPEFYPEIRKYAKNNKIPIISLNTAHFISSIISILKPENVLEIGTAIGYSSLVMAKQMYNSSIYTIELSKPCYDLAINNFKEHNNILKKNKVKIHPIFGKAQDEIPEIKDKFDLIFIDARKDEYIEYLKVVKSKLKKNGIIIADNCLWQGKVFKKHKASDKNTEILISFNNTLFKDDDFITNLIPIGDGILLAVKKAG